MGFLHGSQHLLLYHNTNILPSCNNSCTIVKPTHFSYKLKFTTHQVSELFDINAELLPMTKTVVHLSKIILKRKQIKCTYQVVNACYSILAQHTITHPNTNTLEFLGNVNKLASH